MALKAGSSWKLSAVLDKKAIRSGRTSSSSLDFQRLVAQSSMFLVGKGDQLFYLLSRFMRHTDLHCTYSPHFLSLSDFVFIEIINIIIIYIFSLRTGKLLNSCYLNCIDKVRKANLCTPDLVTPVPFFFICHTRNLFSLQQQCIFFITLN